MNGVKDKNLKHNANTALNCFYIGKSLQQINNIAI